MPDRDIRKTRHMLTILTALADTPEQESHGIALIQATRLSGPALYRGLEHCENNGLIITRWQDNAEPGRPRRRLYKLSPEGVAWVREKRTESMLKLRWRWINRFRARHGG